MAFDPDSPAYRTCCCHVRVCTIIIGLCEVLALLVELIHICVGFAGRVAAADPKLQQQLNITTANAEYAPIGSLIVAIISFVIGLVVIVLLFVGVHKQRHGFLIPHLIFQILGIMGMITAIVILAVGLVVIRLDPEGAVPSTTTPANTVGYREFTRNILIGTIVVLAIWVCFEIWFFVVVLRCYRFFRDQRETADSAVNAQVTAVRYISGP